MNQNFSFQKSTIFQKYWSNETNQKKIAKVYRILPYFIVQKSFEMLQRLLKLNFRSTKVHIKEQTLNTVSKMVKVFCKSLPVIRFFNKVLCTLSGEGAMNWIISDWGRNLYGHLSWHSVQSWDLMAIWIREKWKRSCENYLGCELFGERYVLLLRNWTRSHFQKY